MILGHKVVAHIADLGICDIIDQLGPVISPDPSSKIRLSHDPKANQPFMTKSHYRYLQLQLKLKDAVPVQ